VAGLTCSIGFTSWPFFSVHPKALEWQEVIGLADRCLYSAKESGRNAWKGFGVRPDYKGKAEFKALNDFGTAEAKGIVNPIPSSQDAKSRSRVRPLHEWIDRR
jgi:hypothetical protein